MEKQLKYILLWLLRTVKQNPSLSTFNPSTFPANKTVCTSHLLWKPFFISSTPSLRHGWFTAWVQEITQASKEVVEKTLKPKHSLSHKLQISCLKKKKKKTLTFKFHLLFWILSLLHAYTLKNKHHKKKKDETKPSQAKSLVMKWKQLCQFLSGGSSWFLVISYLQFLLQPRSWWFI